MCRLCSCLLLDPRLRHNRANTPNRRRKQIITIIICKSKQCRFSTRFGGELFERLQFVRLRQCSCKPRTSTSHITRQNDNRIYSCTCLCSLFSLNKFHQYHGTKEERGVRIQKNVRSVSNGDGLGTSAAAMSCSTRANSDSMSSTELINCNWGESGGKTTIESLYIVCVSALRHHSSERVMVRGIVQQLRRRLRTLAAAPCVASRNRKRDKRKTTNKKIKIKQNTKTRKKNKLAERRRNQNHHRLTCSG